MKLFQDEKKQEAYETYLEYYVNCIEDEGLKSFILIALQDAPDYFWTKGLYHEQAPEDEQTTHGLIRRVSKGCYYAKQILRAWELVEYQDVILAAAILHECRKFESAKRGLHGPDTVEWITQLQEDHDISSTKNIVLLKKILDRHDGRRWVMKSGLEPMIVNPIWQTDKIETMMAWLIFTADFIASRKRTEFVW